MRKRERLEGAVAGTPLDRAPVALWRHFPGDDQRSADLARSHWQFQRAYDWDFLRFMPARHFQVVDYGLQSEWRGDTRGFRETRKPLIQRSLAWTELRPLSPQRGALARAVQCLRLLSRVQEDDPTPILVTLHSPLLQAADLSGMPKLLRDLRARPDRLRSGIKQLTDSSILFLRALRKLPRLAGLFLVTELASYDRLSPSEYRAFGLPALERILNEVPAHWWLNIVQVGGQAPMLPLFTDLPLQALNWDIRTGDVELGDLRNMSSAVACGGLHDTQDLLLGTPGLLQSRVREALQQSEARRIILSGSGAGFITTPLSNLHALRAAVQKGL